MNYIKPADMNELLYIYNNIQEYYPETLTKQTLEDLKSMLIASINTFFPHLNYLTNDLEQILDVRYQIVGILQKHKINFVTCEERDDFYNQHRKDIIDQLSIEQKKIFDQYEYLTNLPQPAQKSKEWFDKRNGMISASNGGAAIGCCHYTTIKDVLLDKIGLGKPFKENKYVYHGKKYEKIAIMIYENIYNSKIGEFGLIQHPTIPHIGASPDGIAMSLTLDGQANKTIGRMIEVKCPPSRVILNKGKINGNICPDYYWIQVQLQLECCNLYECDFWQCHITEYPSYNEFVSDEVNDASHSCNQIYDQNETTIIENEPERIKLDSRLRKGAIIELLPFNRSKIPKFDPPEWYGKYIYPPSVMMTPNEYKLWTDETLKNLNNLYPELAGEYGFSRVVYWKLNTSHVELITRQCEWFKMHKPLYDKLWKRVLYYREHIDEAKEDIIGQRLSNDIFLTTETTRIPKIGKKINNNVFLSSNGQKNDDIFLSSDKQCEDNDDVFLSSSDKKYKNNNGFLIGSIKQCKKPILTNVVKPNKPIHLYKNVGSTTDQNDETLDLVIITENRKKKSKF